MYYIGLDIGSTNAKLALLDESGNAIELLIAPTGFSSKDAYKGLLDKLTKKGYDLSLCKIAATGYGRGIVKEADKKITEITCHALGAQEIFKLENFLLIDIGGQDTKIISVRNKSIDDFLMNDKCSAGTGRFLDVMSKMLGGDVASLVELAKKSTNHSISISSLCTVFAESEVISLIGKSVPKEDIAYSIVYSIAQKVASQCSKFDLNLSDIILTGGLCDCDFLVSTLASILNKKIQTNKISRFAGSIGAALSLCKTQLNQNHI